MTLTSAAGARIFVDDARRESLRSPFVRVPVRGGAHAFRVRQGNAIEDAVVGRVVFEGGDELALVQLGPTLAFRAIADQLALHDRRGQPALQLALLAREAPGGVAVVAAAFVAWLVAAAALSASPLPLAAPRTLAAVAGGATLAPVGPYLLARLASLSALVPHARVALACIGGAVLALAVLRAFRVRGAASRLVAFAGPAPAGVGFVALAVGGAWAFVEATMAAGFAAAGLHLLASRRGDASGADDRAARAGGALEEWLLLRVPERLGSLLASMERWVVASAAGALATMAGAGAWLIATADVQIVSMPADAVAARLTGLRRRVEPLVGVPLGRVVFALLGALALAALLHAVWPGR